MLGGVWLVTTIFRDVQREERAARAAKPAPTREGAFRQGADARSHAGRTKRCSARRGTDDVADGGDDPGDQVDSADSGGGWSWDDD